MKHTLRTLFISTLLSILAFDLSAQISGAVTINQGAATAGTNYQTFTDLATALNTSGINGPLTVNVVANSGPYAEQVIFNQITGANASNRIVINGNNNLVTFNGINAAQPSIIGMNGADFFTFNNLNVQGTGTYAYCAMLWNGADFNLFSACTFSVPFNTTTTLHIPVVFSGSGTSYATAGNSGNNNTFRGCTMYSGYAGVWMYGLTSTPFNSGNTVERCNISDFYYCGLYGYYSRNLTMRNNILERLTRTLFTTTYGSFFIYNSGLMCDGNEYRRMFEANIISTSACYPIYGYYSPSANNPEINTIRNNLIYDIKSNGVIYGLYYYYVNGNIYNNTISLDHAGATAGTTWAIYTYGGAGYPVDLKNNMISVTRGGTGQKVGLYIAVTGNITSDRNDIFVQSAAGSTNTAYFNQLWPTLAGYQASSNLDATSFSLDPQYSSITNSLYPTNVTLNNQGIPLGIQYDEALAIRNQVTPDIGALEFLTPNCSGTPSLTSVSQPSYQICSGEDVPLGLTSLSSNAGLTYQWNVSTGSSTGPFTAIPNANAPFYTAPAVSANSFYQVVQTCTLPGGGSMNAVGALTIAGITTTNVPYFESFEGIGRNGRLPNCSWSASNLGGGVGGNAGGTCLTYTSSSTLGRTPRTGSRFASFYYNPGGTNYFYTNGINLVAGVTYSTELWYQTEFFGYNNWTDLSILYGTTQSTTGLVNVASTNGPALSNVYKKLSNTFTVATSGLYYFAIRATGSTTAAAEYLSWDDFSITIPCTPASGNIPSVGVSASSSTICAGQTLALSATGAASYTWNGNFSGANYTVNPSGNSIYSVVGANALTGCTATANSSIAVSPLPVVSLIAGATSVCIGQSTNLSAVGANSYTWNTGSNAQQISVSPSTVSNYSVTGINALGCRASASIAINVNALPNIVATASPSQICIGQTATLQASGAVSYQWTYSNLYSQSNTAIVTGNSNFLGLNNYTVIGTDANGCSRTSTVALNVNASPSISVSGPSLACLSTSFSLTAFGASSYTWFPGNLIGNVAVTTLTGNTTFTVLGTNSVGCSNSSYYTIGVVSNSQPAMLAIASSSSACASQSVNLSAIGATSYTWYPGAISGQFITVNPTVTTNYTVTGPSNCAVTVNTYVTVFINPAPVLSLTASSSSLCAGSSATLTASGASTYSWLPLYSSGATFVASPLSSMIYTVNGTNATGCAGSQTLNLTVVNLPSVSISSFDNSICTGSSATLAAIGANTYVWSNGATTTSIVVTPTANTSYSVVGSIGSCNASNLKTISLLPLPVLSIVAGTTTLCAGQSVNLLALGANTYTWNTGSTTQQIAVSPSVTTTYTLSGKDANGCTANTNQLITINALPVLSITAVNNPICVGETATLNALGAANYQWSSSNLLLNASLIAVSPQSTGIYTVTGTDNNGCSSKAVATVSVNLCTGIEETLADHQIKLYPNPSNGLIYLEMLNDEEARIVIYNAIGQIITSQEAALLNQIDLSPYSNGLYTVVISQNNKLIYKAKLIKE